MSPPADYTHHQHLGIDVVTLQAESLLGGIDVNRIAGELMALIEGGTRRLVIDLQNVKFAGSAALGMLMGLSNELASRGGRLVLANPEHIDPLLRVTRARGLFEIADDTLSAMEMLRR